MSTTPEQTEKKVVYEKPVIEVIEIEVEGALCILRASVPARSTGRGFGNGGGGGLI